MKIILVEHESRTEYDCLDELSRRFPHVEVVIFETVEGAIASAASDRPVLICACRHIMTDDPSHVFQHIHRRLPGTTLVVIGGTADLLSLVSLFGADAAAAPLPIAPATPGAFTPGYSAHLELTARENCVMLLLSQGLPNKLIACRMNVSVSTIKTHLAHIFRKIGVEKRRDAICRFGLASRHGEEAAWSDIVDRLPAPLWPVTGALAG